MFQVDENPLVNKAWQFAKEAHKDQKRKYTGEPYLKHLEEVAEFVCSAEGTREMIAAAYLHDCVEDQGVTLETLIQEFGPEVAALVEMVTDVSKPEDGNRAVRKQKDLEHLALASEQGKTIKLADLISNSQDIVQHDKDFARVYIVEKEKLLEVLQEGNHSLYILACGLVYHNKKLLEQHV